MNTSRKGVGVGGILKLTLALMVASLFVSASTFGDIGRAVEQSMEHIQGNTSYTVEVDDDETLSNISMYVRQRAGNGGCKQSNGHLLPGVSDFNTVYQQNQEGGYPALKDAYMGRYPNCLGTASTLARGDNIAERGFNAFYDTGNDMEGIYSRVKFEVTEPIAIKTSEHENNPTWLENRIVGVSNLSYAENTKSIAECQDLGAAARFLGMGDHFVVYFVPDRAGTQPYRADKYMQEFDGSGDRLSRRAYCHPDGEAYSWGAITISQFDQHPVISATRRLENKIVLCPGDKGYIQMNKGTPKKAAEAGESLWSGSAANFPHIQITSLGSAPGDTCLPAEMAPAGEFNDVNTVNRIELPLEAGDQIAAMIPDKFENAFEGFVEDYWEDSFADRSVSWLEDQASTAASIVADGVEMVSGAIDDVASFVGGLLGNDDAPDDVAEFLDEEGIDPMQDMFHDVQDAVTSAMDSTMKDSLHLELSFTNEHLDMDDDAVQGLDFRGGFQINLYKSGDDNDLNGQFETEPMGGLYHEDVPQGVEGAGELDALQSGWDGNGGIDDLGCYVKAELVLEQKQRNLEYPERAEQVWTIWIGDQGDEGSNELNNCDDVRDGRINYQRHGVAWGGTITLDDLQLQTNEYYPNEGKLEVEATATAGSSGDGNIDGALLEIGKVDGSTFDRAEFENCGGDSCTVTGNISNLQATDEILVKTLFKRDGDESDETQTVDISDYSSPDQVLGSEEWSWNSEYNSTSNLFDVNVTYGGPEAARSANINDAVLTVDNVTDSTTQVQELNCDQYGQDTNCKIEMNDLEPGSGPQLTINATIEKNDLRFWDSKTFTP